MSTLSLPTKSELGLRKKLVNIEITETGGHFVGGEIKSGPLLAYVAFNPIVKLICQTQREGKPAQELCSTCHVLGTGVWEATGQNQQ